MVAHDPNGAGKVPAVNEDEAKTIRKIVERVLAKDSLTQISNDLNKEGVPSPGHSSRQITGKSSDSEQWYTTTLRSLLGNPSCSARSSRAESRSCVSAAFSATGWRRPHSPTRPRPPSPPPLLHRRAGAVAPLTKLPGTCRGA
ncbi:recombinase family protein [Streptomyces sp. HNM0645]|nr:recombinase family protein [Streptomyces sp. HNM0645]MDI9885967.1 recombinase family protein [Streptomyces sp. HNM0645]